MTDYEYGVVVIMVGPKGLGIEARNEAIEAAEQQGGELVPGAPVELTSEEVGDLFDANFGADMEGIRAFRFQMRRAAVSA